MSRLGVACLIALAGCDTVFGVDEVTRDAGGVDLTTPGDWSSVAAGDSHVCAIKLDGSLWCWGANDYGQLGLGAEVTSAPAPQQVSGGPWIEVRTRVLTTCGIQQDGSLWCWGNDLNGQVGDGLTVNVFAPYQVAGTWKDVAPGASHTCAIDAAGITWCWGDNTTGQLGVGDASPHATRVMVAGGILLSSIESGYQHTCALAVTDQTAWCWGSGVYGQLGNGTSTQSLMPTQVSDQPWTTITTGAQHTCARRPDGHLRCWGQNQYANLGSSYPYNTSSPIKVADDDVWVNVVAGANHTCATRMDGSMACWGNNDTGQLGGAPGGTVPRPTTVEGGARTWDVLAAGRSTTCGISPEHNLWCMGGGVASQGTMIGVPAQVTGSWKAVVADSYGTCGIDSAGALSCWGSNANGQLGDETYVNRGSPTKIADPSWIDVSMGSTHACAIRDDGSLYCWGTAFWGLGDGTTNRVTPSPIAPMRKFDHVSCGTYWTCAIERSTSALFCWGYNAQYQLGTGDGVEQPMPTMITSQQWTSITTGAWHSCGVVAGDAQCWGTTYYGAIGDGVVSSAVATPKAITPVTTTYSGFNHTCAIVAGGTAQCWGLNSTGQLGVGDTTTVASPTDVVGGGLWTELSTGASHTCGISTTGALWCWGNNSSGQLGILDPAVQLAPIQVGSDLNWSHVSSGATHTCAIRIDESLWCWGTNYYGELGLGNTTMYGPVLIP